MLRWAKTLWVAIAAPSRKIAVLTRDNESLSLGLRNATDRAAILQDKLNTVNGAGCPGCAALKPMVNHLVLAGGSRIKPYDDYGPTLPESFGNAAAMEEPITRSPRQAIREQNSDFLKNLEQSMRVAIKEPQQ